MRVYHGTWKDNLEVSEAVMSRYGFWAMFFSTGGDLAKKYAEYWARKKGMGGSGHVYEFEINRPHYTIDMQDQVSYGRAFRETMYRIQRNHKSALLTNIFDSPLVDRYPLSCDNIVVVFDKKQIQSWTKIQ